MAEVEVDGAGDAVGASAPVKVPHDAVMHVRLSEAEQVALDACWRAEGFKNRSSYVRHLVREDIGAPSTNPAILSEIEDAVAAFGAAGRNLNQVTRAINEQRKAGVVFNPHDLVEQDDLLALKESFDGMRKAISKAVKSVRAATGSPEAVVKLASWGSGAASARDQLNYISREGELELEMSDGTTIESREEIRDLVDDWSDRFSHRKDGRARNTVHFVLSTPPETDREATLEAGREWARETFGEKHEYALVAHNDTEHPHVHIVAEVKGRDRSRFTVGPSDFHDMRERFAEKCRDRGIEMNATRRDVRGAARGESMALRKMREEGRTPRIDGIARQQTAERGRDGRRPHPAEIARRERLAHVAKEHRDLAYRLSMGNLATMGEGRREQIDASKALRELASRLEQGGERTRPDKIYGEVERQDQPRDPKLAQLPSDSTPEQVSERARAASEVTAKTLEAATALRDRLPEGTQRDVVIAQIAVLEKSNAALQRAEQGIGLYARSLAGIDRG